MNGTVRHAPHCQERILRHEPFGTSRAWHLNQSRNHAWVRNDTSTALTAHILAQLDMQPPHTCCHPDPETSNI